VAVLWHVIPAKIHLLVNLFRGADMDTLLSVDEAARRLGGLSKYTIHAWLSSGKLRRTKVGSRTMIRESELQRVIEDGGKSEGPRKAN
jgi:excisionase family DNA binding protein